MEEKIESEKRENLNMRVPQSLKGKIRDKMNEEKKTPDEFFNDMLNSYIMSQIKNREGIDFSEDIKDLEVAVSRIITIYKNVVEKTALNESILRDTYKKQTEAEINTIKESYTSKIADCERENQMLRKNYNTVSSHAEELIEASKTLQSSMDTLIDKNKTLEDLASSYKEQILSLQSKNNDLMEKLNKEKPNEEIEKIKLDFEKNILSVEKKHQREINEWTEKYNKLLSESTNKISELSMLVIKNK